MTPIQIKRLRKRLGLTLKEAGKLVHVTDAAWCRWERGQRVPGKPVESLMRAIDDGNVRS